MTCPDGYPWCTDHYTPEHAGGGDTLHATAGAEFPNDLTLDGVRGVINVSGNVLVRPDGRTEPAVFIGNGDARTALTYSPSYAAQIGRAIVAQATALMEATR